MSETVAKVPAEVVEVLDVVAEAEVLAEVLTEVAERHEGGIGDNNSPS